MLRRLPLSTVRRRLSPLLMMVLWSASTIASSGTSTGPSVPDPQFSPRVQSWYEAGQFVTLRGLQIYYQIRGKGPTLLLIHGYPYNSYDFHRVVETLSEDYTVVLFDLPGMGFSDKPQDQDYSFEGYAELVNDLAEHLEIREADLLTHDLGVSIGQELIARESSNRFRIRSVAFMNGGLFTDVYRPRLIQRVLSQSPDWLGGFFSRHLTRGMVEGSVLRVFGPDTPPDPDLLDDWWSILNYLDGKSIAHRLGRLVFDKENYQQRWISAMQNTRIPMVYLCGPADPNSGRHMAKRYQELVPMSSVHFFTDGIGHWPQIEAPEQVVTAFREFTLKPPGKSPLPQ